jgi:TPR repeat protein
MHSFKHGIVATILVFSTAPGITGPLERLFGTEEADQPAQASTVAISSSGPLAAGEAAYRRGDYATALRLWLPLADRGDAGAQFNLGVAYNNGNGVVKDYVQAYMWFTLAAAGGDRTAAGYRDTVEKSMSTATIAEAQKLAREWDPYGARAEQPAKRTRPNQQTR